MIHTGCPGRGTTSQWQTPSRSEWRFAQHGKEAESCRFGLDGSEDVEAVVTAALSAQPWECVVIGGGVRNAGDQLHLFERVVNLVRRHAANAAIAFNSTPGETFDAAARWVDVPR